MRVDHACVICLLVGNGGASPHSSPNVMLSIFSSVPSFGLIPARRFLIWGLGFAALQA